MPQRPKHQGRVTPKAKRPARSAPSAAQRPTPQVGRRPSNPGFLVLLGAMWLACGVVALAALSASWKLVPGIVFIGIGLFFLRAAATTVVRRNPEE